MNLLVQEIEKLKKTNIKKVIDGRIKEFKDKGKGNKKEIFSELCFCLMTANFNAQRSIKIQETLGERVCDLPQKELIEKLKELGHRFPNKRAEYIYLAREKDIIPSREWLVQNIKGLGMKEASHFLRNIGYDDVAIIDFHIIDILQKHNVITKPKTITPRIYIEIEDKLRKLAKETNLTLAELDLYLWFMETGTVLK